MPPTPALIGVGSVFIDDIVLPNGQTYMGRLGGGVVHALMGTVIWGDRPGLIGFAGDGIPREADEILQRYFDVAGLYRLSIPQMRAWQIFEEDGSRRELYRVAEITPYIEGPQPHHLPAEYRSARAIYLTQSFAGIRAWNQVTSGLLSLWEPLQQIMVPGNYMPFREVLQDCQPDIVSPNILEARALYGKRSPDTLIDAMLEDGANIVALRMGEEGSLIACRETGERHFVEAISVPRIVDQTGAGNMYCGAFLLGLMRNLSLKEAGCMATVAASFCIEQIGVVNPEQVPPHERDRRYQALLKTR